MSRTAPKQKPHRSEQSVGTPPEFIAAVRRRFGPISADLAADHNNAVHARYYTATDDALSEPWHDMGGLLWLNPPYANIAPWAKRCAEERKQGARIALLVPASVGSEWFAEHVEGHAYVFALRTRLTFVGHNTP